MNQGKLEVVKQEMARVNVHILGISELKRTGMSEFNSDDHYIYNCGQEYLRRKGEERLCLLLAIPCLEFASSVPALLSQSSIQEIKQSPGNCN